MDNDEDLKFESSEEELGEAKLGGDLKRLREKLKEAESKAAEYLAGWQRAKADYLNLKREEEEAKKELAAFAKKPILLELIHLADTFDLAFSNKESWESVPLNWRQGVEYIHKELLTILDRHELAQIDPLGLLFNPEEHHSVGALETDDPNEDNKVIQVLKKGYKLNGQVIRPAQVKVGELKA